MRLLAFFLVAAATTLISSAGERGQPEPQSDDRKLLADPKPEVRLRAALTLVRQGDEQAVSVLIDLLGVLPHEGRLQAEKALQQLAGEWSPAPALRGDDELSRKIRREAWAGWWRTLDGPALLAVFRQKDGKDKLPPASARLLAIRKPAGAAEALLAYLPSTDDYIMKEEIGKALKNLAMADGTPDPTVLAALSDPLPLRRIAAAEALAETGGAKQWPLIRKLLTDANPEVRLRVAVALVYAHDKEAVPALIDLVGELPRSQAWEAEDLLQFLAAAKAPPRASADTPAARTKLRAAWQAWWKTSGAEVNMAELDKMRGGLGLTLVAEITAKGAAKVVVGPGGAVPAAPPVGATDRVVALDRAGQPQWQIDNLNHPIDVQMLPGGRVLIAEFYGNRITERDTKGKILWEVNVTGLPVNVQRLPNGNTFIALYGPAAQGSPLIEVDPTGRTVATFNAGGPKAAGAGVAINDMILAGCKMPDGQMVCLLGYNTCIRLDATGKETSRFVVPQAKASSILNTVGNIDVTAKGNVLFLQNDSTVNEFDATGKIVWKANAAGVRATRLLNGNTLVANLNGGVTELDSTGRTVWQYTPPAGYQSLRARRQ